MKTYSLLIIGMLCYGTIQAQQKIEKHLNFSGKTDVELSIQIADSINIMPWNKNEVYVEASVNINDNTDNEAYLTSFEETGNCVKVNARFKENYFKEKKDCCNKSDIWWRVYIPEHSNVSVETINADMTVRGETGKMNLKSISGFIDMAIPEKRSANLDFSTISGTIYSDLDLKPENTRSGVPVKIRDKLNNGGPEIKLETISGDIFFRKSD
jgi:hypothetical protein